MRQSKTATLDGKPVIGVTAANYAQLGSAFIAANGGEGFLIALEDGRAHGVRYRATVRQWGAWKAFFRRIGLKDRLIGRDYWTVPAEWPSLFTNDVMLAEDHAAGEAFAKGWFDRKLAMEARR